MLAKAAESKEATEGEGTDDLELIDETGKKDHIEEIRVACRRMLKRQKNDVKRIALLHFIMILNYYQDVRDQARMSFRCALIAAGVGTLVFMVPLVLIPPKVDEITIRNVSLIGGAVIEVVSGINFALYYRAARQFSTFHVCLERTNRFFLANALCEEAPPPEQDKMRASLMEIIAKAPLLTFGIKRPCHTGERGTTQRQDGDADSVLQ